jgi:hypothetical protein
VRDNLGSMKQCESLVNSRVLSALNQAVTSGFLSQDLDKHKKPFTLEVYVTSVSIKLSVQNGESIRSVMESGVVYQSSKESRLEEAAT